MAEEVRRLVELVRVEGIRVDEQAALQVDGVPATG